MIPVSRSRRCASSRSPPRLGLRTSRCSAPLLSAAPTVWRFGRQQEEAGRLESGEAFGSFDQWCRWCRDPLVALGCQDRVARIHELRAADPQRELSAELLVTWWEHHKDEWVSQKTLAEAVREIADPEKRGPQYLRTRLNGFDGTRSAGFVFERFKDPNRPTMPSTYRLTQAAPRG